MALAERIHPQGEQTILMVKALSWAAGQCLQLLLHLEHRCLKIKCPERLYCFLLAPHTHLSFVFHISEKGAMGPPANPARAVIPHSDTSKFLTWCQVKTPSQICHFPSPSPRLLSPTTCLFILHSCPPIHAAPYSQKNGFSNCKWDHFIFPLTTL